MSVPKEAYELLEKSVSALVTDGLTALGVSSRRKAAINKSLAPIGWSEVARLAEFAYMGKMRQLVVIVGNADEDMIIALAFDNRRWGAPAVYASADMSLEHVEAVVSLCNLNPR